MRFVRERRRALGLLALLAPLPLPFNGVIGWLSLTAYWLAVVLFMVRVAASTYHGLKPWVMNLLGLAYLPILFFEMSTWWRGQQLMRSLTHLILFALVVKLFSLKGPKDYWHALLAIFFLFLASMGTSVNPSVAIYLVTFLFGALLVLARFTAYEVISEHSAHSSVRDELRLRRFVGAVGVLVLMAAVPLFAFLPRLRQPYLFGPSVGNASLAAGGSFTGGMRLDTIGNVRTGRSVVLRFTTHAPEFGNADVRFKVATYDLFRRNSWKRGQRMPADQRRGPDGYFRLQEGATGEWLEIWQSKGGGRELALPVGTAAFDVQVSSVGIDDSGVVTLPVRPAATFDYRAGLSHGRVSVDSDSSGVSRLDLDDTGASDRVRALAAEVMGTGTMGERVRRLESYLMREHSYTLELGSEEPDDPVENFLFETRAGHCEYFATSMVLMLRSQGVPARMVSGYLGSDLNPLEGYYIVRQTNAHAWVEALVDGEGWQVFDPTPAIGRPQVGEGGLLRLLTQTYDYMLFRWDRYVLTYGFLDQIDTLMRARDLLRDLWAWFGDEEEEVAEEVAQVAPEGQESSTRALGDPPSQLLRWSVITLIALFGLFWLWRARAPWNATAAYRSLRAHLGEEAGLEATLPPLEVERRFVASCPQAAGETRRIVRLYLEESFASRKLTDDELAELRDALGSVRKALRKAA